jgi:preprotein translocase subunit SecY
MTSEFIRRAAFTLGALLIYRLGCNIPLPGINVELLDQIMRTNASGLGWFMPPTGVQRMAIFALGIVPYISAAVLLQVAGIVLRPLRALQMQGDRGRQILRKLTLGLTVIFAALQAYGIAGALEQINGGVSGVSAVENPGWQFLTLTTLSMAGGTIFLAWLSEQITAFGIGNGIALILLASTVTAIREPVVETIYLGQRGQISSNDVLTSLAAIVLVTGLVVFVERARRCFQIDYPKRQIGDRVFEGLSLVLPVKLNPAGMIPAILASWLLSILNILILMILSFNNQFFVGAAASDQSWLDLINTQLVAGRPAYYVLYGLLVFLCTFFYAAYLFSPEDIAARLQNQGATIRSVAPGDATVTHLDDALSRTVLFGAAYLTIICLTPVMLLSFAHMQIQFGGLPLLILVCTVLDFEDQVRGYVGFSPRGRSDPNMT